CSTPLFSQKSTVCLILSSSAKSLRTWVAALKKMDFQIPSRCTPDFPDGSIVSAGTSTSQVLPGRRVRRTSSPCGPISADEQGRSVLGGAQAATGRVAAMLVWGKSLRPLLCGGSFSRWRCSRGSGARSSGKDRPKNDRILPPTASASTQPHVRIHARRHDQ